MKILYVANVRLPTEKAHGVQIMKACEAFALARHELELVVPNRKSPIKEDACAYYGIKICSPITRLFTIDTIGWGSIGYVFQSVLFGLVAALYVIGKAPDVVYGRDEIVLAIIGMVTSTKIVWESHDGSWNVWARYLVKRAGGIVVVTDGAVDFYKEYGVPAEKLLAVSNGIDLQDFAHPETKEVARMRLGVPQDEKLALYIGKLDGWKGVDTLLEASKLLKNIKVGIIGGDKKQIGMLSPKYPDVYFLGFRPYRELANNQVAGDVLVVPNTGKDKISIQFTSPLKLIAALASGRPVVVSDLPSTRWIADGVVLFVSPDDPKALADGISRLFDDPKTGRELAQKASVKATQFSWSLRANRILQFLAGL